MKTAVFAVSALVLAAGAAMARPPMDVSVSAVSLDGLVVRGPGAYSTGFEAPEFAIGGVHLQSGWQANANVVVSDANPAAGAQHMRIPLDTTVAAGSLRLALGPNAGALPVGPSSVSVDFNISATGGANYGVQGQAPSQAFLTWRVEFDWEFGDILVLDDVGAGLQFVDTGADWTPGVYSTLRVDADPTADTIQYYLNDTLFYSGVAGIFAGTTVEQMVFRSDNFQNPGEVGDFDNLVVTPAPGALALLGLGGLAAARRRRN
jgi:MYXO-CTERM domain-containing protein